MNDPKDPNVETCMVTGDKAYAAFFNGRGVAWYGSKYDTTQFVILKDQVEGPLSDAEIERRLVDGSIKAYGSYMDGLYAPNVIGEEAARMLFLQGAFEQVEALRNPKPLNPIKAASIPAAKGKRPSFATMVTELPRAIKQPSWFASIPQIAPMLHPAGEMSFDFLRLGAAYALVELASGRTFGDRALIAEVASQTYRFTLELQKAQLFAEEAELEFIESLSAQAGTPLSAEETEQGRQEFKQ